jgi:hypothetical protein
MFRYYLKLGALGIRRNPALSALMDAAIATGIGACMTIVNSCAAVAGTGVRSTMKS